MSYKPYEAYQWVHLCMRFSCLFAMVSEMKIITDAKYKTPHAYLGLSMVICQQSWRNTFKS